MASIQKDTWSRRFSQKSEIMQLPAFVLLCAEFPAMRQFLESQASEMVRSAQRTRTGTCHSYVVHDGKIGYNRIDTIDTRSAYGYETLFAAMKENTAAQPVVVDCGLHLR